LALQNGDGKIVNDILGFSDNGELYIIELKSLRHKKELENQVDNFKKFIENNIELFYKILIIHGFEWDRDIEKIQKAIVWNKLHNQKVFGEEIIEFVYDKTLLESDKNILKIEQLKQNTTIT
jgi:hypothetical protein